MVNRTPDVTVEQTTLKPNKAIRRFDVFAEFQRQTALRKGMPADEAKGHGLWLAKVVAARRFGTKRTAEGKGGGASPESAQERPAHEKWHTLEDEAQTDALFDREIVERMGAAFYETVFVPAITAAMAQGLDYMDIRDTIRQTWKP